MYIHPNDTALTNALANDIFGEPFLCESDASLSALIRAIVINHNEGDSIESLVSKAEIYSHPVISPGDAEYIMQMIARPFCICKASGWKINDFHPSFDGWRSYDDSAPYLDKYLSGFAKCRIFTNESEQRVVVLVEKITSNWAQAFASMLLCVLPWYYPTFTDEAKAFFKALSIPGKKSDKIPEEETRKILLDYVQAAADKIDLKSHRLKSILRGLGDLSRKKLTEVLSSNLANCQRSIQSHRNTLVALYGELENYQIELSALENSPVKGDDELIEFFSQHKNVYIDRVRHGNIEYHVVDTLEFYDEDEARRNFENPYSWMRGYGDWKYFYELFVNKRGIIRVSAPFTLCDVRSITVVSGNYSESQTLPNPHIYFFGCSGANDQYYDQYAQEGDWALAIEQTISATKNWNIGDSAVGRRMFNWLINEHPDEPCIYVSDGSPIDEVTEDMRLVSFSEFKKLIDDASGISETTATEEESNNG